MSTDYFSLFSEKEVFGSNGGSNSTAESANTQLDYFKTPQNRIKKMDDSADGWWERSPCGYSSTFCSVTSSGDTGVTMAFISKSLAPFGCI